MEYTRRFMFALDVLLLVVTILLFAPHATGLSLHEWLGVAVVPALVLHLLISWKWMVVALQRLFTSDGTLRGRINLLLNIGLFVAFALELITGLGISRAAVPALGVGTIDDGAWRRLHNETTAYIRILAPLHLAMNWHWFRTTYVALRNSSPIIRMRRQLATAWATVSLRVVAIVAALTAVSLWPLMLLGPTTHLRLVRQNEFRIFAASIERGVPNLIAQVVIITLGTYIGYRWLRVRL